MPSLSSFPRIRSAPPQAIVAGHGFDHGHRLGTDFGFRGGWFRASPPDPADRLTMPAEEGIGLNNVERLFPTADCSCKQDQEQPIGPGTRWALDLTTEDDQLLAKQRIFRDEVGLGASEIGERPCQKGSAPGARPAQYTLLDPTE
jgi:hypothetical protein